MLNREQLAETLKSVRVEDLRKESGVSAKTIYRLRQQKHSTTLETAALLLAAIDRLKARNDVQ